MHAPITVTPARLPELLLAVATVRPVFLWGQPGIGKSSLVEQFAAALGMECVSLLGTQLAPEDLIGVPTIQDGLSCFCPPAVVARPEPYVLFLDELNASSHEVQKSFYSLILEGRLGEYRLPAGSVVVGAGNRAQDSAIVRPMSSALVNRMVHLHLVASPRDWLQWAAGAGIHPWVVDYVRARPDHLVSPAPKTEEPFSTPRSWHVLSDVLTSLGPDVSEDDVRTVALGCVSPVHARQFTASVALLRHAYDLDAILKGNLRWPADPAQRDVLYFLAQSLRARLGKELPRQRRGGSAESQALAHRAKGLLTELAEISLEVAQLVVAGGGEDGDGGDGQGLPAWFLSEVVRDLPRLAAARA
ncbi:MoxR-like ATPase [Kineococcus xinjiangensis]|uniref:MoxR-like ATPase n=1 Tax=Kineococcus xinjiangensis TaxID=512762 RepID=A0A2S6IT05_9ACTN|nr:MoxR family ATPase [Kineococcus xinjiangensis]PPK97383.1 MoxR-like ATPase [Kineococcus xinjiangensis]